MKLCPPLLWLWLTWLGLFGTTLCSDVPRPGEKLCPTSCELSGLDTGNWTTYSSLDRLKFCNDPMLLDFVVHTPLDDKSKGQGIKACVLSAADLHTPAENSSASKKYQAAANTTVVSVELAQWNALDEAGSDKVDVSAAVSAVQARMKQLPTSSIIFASHKKTAVGIWVGALVRDDIFRADVINTFLDKIGSGETRAKQMAQLCTDTHGADSVFGITVSHGDSALETVQADVKAWADSTCIKDAPQTSQLGVVALSTKPAARQSRRSSPTGILWGRGLCRSITVGQDEGCYALADRCGVSLDTFKKYNPGSDFCSSLQPKQPVCCSEGTLPRPEKGSDGSCAAYTVQGGDTCASIAASNAITTSELEKWNEKTWGWFTCGNLQAKTKICLSDGSPPKPAWIPNAECGPTVPGTQKPTNGVDLASLNPCPLKACCNFWGHCGTTAQFCSKAGDGVPPTLACVSNCGTDIIQSDPPAEFKRVAYFEGFNTKRSCLKMDSSQISASDYTHIHFAFIGLTHDWKVETSDTQYQWSRFKDLKTKMKKIVSFGGWSFSAEAPNYEVFRTGVTPENRDTLATNIANFVMQNNLDGVDIDWEYPSATDIPGIPSGGKEEAEHYLAFLTLLRYKLPKEKSVSIAAPASFWYLKPFPIARMSDVLDYIVFMAYDLHGQWDFEKPWAAEGCPEGSCLRSHVNMTETLISLAMITKAGVPSNKVLVGVSSYGRSFQMASAGCTGPSCKFTGPGSGAKKGPCTDTAGYISNAEIRQIVQNGAPGLQQFTDNSDSDVVVYGDNWVAYMTDERKAKRIDKYKSLNFGGISDWAVDLGAFYSPPSDPNNNGSVLPYSSMTPILQGCDKYEGKHVTQAWTEAGEIAWRHWQWSPKGKWQDVMDLYMGEGTRKDWDFWGDPGPIGQNIGKEYLIHFSGFLEHPINTWSYWYCHEEDRPGFDPKKPECGKNTLAYTWDQPGAFFSFHYVVLCPTWWDFSRTKSLREVENRANGDIPFQMKMENWKPIRARTALHETYHWEHTVSEPRCRDLAYSPTDVVQLAKTQGSDRARLNAESFAQAGLAIHVMDTFHLSTPPTPGGGKVSAEAAAADDEMQEKSLDAPPAGWVSPMSYDTAVVKPDPKIGAYYITEYGNAEPYQRECQHNSVFWSKAQCSVYCEDPGKCESEKNSDGQAIFRCNCGWGQGSRCYNGNYTRAYECEARCHGGKCSAGEGQLKIECTGCPALVCKPGEYKNPAKDACDTICQGGTCSFSPGLLVCTCD